MLSGSRETLSSIQASQFPVLIRITIGLLAVATQAEVSGSLEHDEDSAFIFNLRRIFFRKLSSLKRRKVGSTITPISDAS